MWSVLLWVGDVIGTVVDSVVVRSARWALKPKPVGALDQWCRMLPDQVARSKREWARTLERERGLSRTEAAKLVLASRPSNQARPPPSDVFIMHLLYGSFRALGWVIDLPGSAVTNPAPRAALTCPPSLSRRQKASRLHHRRSPTH